MRAHPILCLSVLSLMLAALVPGQSGGTQVQGAVAGRWTKAGSPYCVIGNLTVSQDVLPSTLTIESGVVVIASPGVQIRVTGTLLVKGTAAEPVLFTGADPSNPWMGLLFDRSGSQSVLDHCRVEQAIDSGIRIVDTAVVLNSCEIADNGSPTGGGGIDASLSSRALVLNDCRIVDNQARMDGGGMRAALGTAALTLIDCEIRRNHANPDSLPGGNRAGGGLYVAGGGAVTLTRCEFTDNQCHADDLSFDARASGGGVYVRDAASVMLEDCLVADNLCDATGFGHMGCMAYVSPRGCGVCVESAPAALRRCIVRDNVGTAQSARGFPGYSICAPVSSGEGGGVAWFDAGGAIAGVALTLENCVVSGNALAINGERTQSLGGAVWISGGRLSVTNSTLVHNSASSSGYLPPLVTPDKCSGVYAASSVPHSIDNSILYHNQPVGVTLGGSTASLAVRYSDVERGWPGVGNISASPALVGPTSSTWCGAVEITAGSPCVDAGDPATSFADVSFPPSLGGPRNDMGANGGPLAGGWANWTRASIALSIDPPRGICATTTLEFVTAGGAMTQPVAVFLEAIDGIPLSSGPFWIPVLGQFCAAGRWRLEFALPPVACSVSSLTFRSYALSAAGALVASNAVVW